MSRVRLSKPHICGNAASPRADDTLPNAGTSMTVDDEAKHESLMGDITMPIDYERMKRAYPKQKAALTRAKKITDPIARKFKVIEVCRAAVREWNIIGAWPDGWSLWQRELSDALFAAQRAGDNQMHVGVNQLEDLA